MDFIFRHLTVYDLSLFSLANIVLWVVVAAHILLNKTEESTSAVMWLLVTFFMPVFGVILYLFFGINRISDLTKSIRRGVAETKKELKALESVIRRYHENIKTFVAAKLMDYDHVLDHLLPESVPLDGNHLQLLENGDAAYPEMIKAVKSAESSIHMQSYIIGNDPAAREIFDALREKAAAGVKVKVIYDSFGSARALFGHFFDRYQNRNSKNIKIRAFARVHLLSPWRVQLRNHRKLLIVDGKKAFVGGINISAKNVSKKSPRDKYIHDLHAKIEGPAVLNFQYCFLRDWACCGGGRIRDFVKKEHFPVHQGTGKSIMRVISGGPGQDYEATQKVFFTAATVVKTSLWIISPYFVPEKSFINALIMAASRGVDVRVIVPATTDHLFVAWACKSLYPKLLESGIRVFEKQGVFSHAKAMLVDGQWAYMGSSNCDVRSFRLNYELDFAVNGGEFMEQLSTQFLTELEGSREILLEDVRGKSLPRRLAENFFSLFTPIL